MVHGMVMVHDITSTVHKAGHLMASQNRIICQLQMPTTPLCMKKLKKTVSVMGFS